MAVEVLYEDNHIIIVNKKAGELVQGDKTGDKTIADDVKEYVKKKYNKPGDVFLGTVHRIDRPTSGVVIFARTSKALERLNKMFQDKEIKKTYWAVTENAPEKKSGKLVDYLVRNEKQNKSYAGKTEKPGSKIAELTYELVGKSDNYFFLKVEPLTGRHHQIRVQLAAMGAIIKGDLKYGARRSNKNGSIHLHAQRVEFVHPVSGNKIDVSARPPDEPNWNMFWKLSPQITS